PWPGNNHRPGWTTFLRHPITRRPALRSPASTPFARRQPGVSAGLVSRGLALAVTYGYGNINPLSIDYACRPRLRTRLTLGGSAWPRKPWSFGGQGSHLPYRYSCLHSHSPHLHHTITRWLLWMQDAPLPSLTAAATSAGW